MADAPVDAGWRRELTMENGWNSQLGIFDAQYRTHFIGCENQVGMQKQKRAGLIPPFFCALVAKIICPSVTRPTPEIAGPAFLRHNLCQRQPAHFHILPGSRVSSASGRPGADRFFSAPLSASRHRSEIITCFVLYCRHGYPSRISTWLSGRHERRGA